MAKRSKLVFSLGLAIAAAGGFLAYRAIGGRGPGATSGGVTVLTASNAIPAGTTGAAAAGQGMVGSKRIPAAVKPPNALTDVTELAGKTAVDAIPPGTILTLDRFPPAQTRIGTVQIPPEKMALAVQMANVPGVAGFAGAGDRIDIFGVTKQGPDGPGVRLILQNIEVLNVNGTALVPSAGQPEGKPLVFLLAVSPAEAERIVYLATFEQLYFSLVPKDQAPARPTPGVDAEDVLRAA
jgi:Flp pilus assembly protein CpaB